MPSIAGPIVHNIQDAIGQDFAPTATPFRGKPTVDPTDPSQNVGQQLAWSPQPGLPDASIVANNAYDPFTGKQQMFNSRIPAFMRTPQFQAQQMWHQMPEGRGGLNRGGPAPDWLVGLYTGPRAARADNLNVRGQFPTQPGQAPQYFAQGGMVGGQPPGAPMQPQAGLAAPQGAPQLSPQMVDANVQDMMQRNPALVQHMQQLIQRAVQSGQLNMQELQFAAQLAQACLNNPKLWPQLRQAAISHGLAGPNDLPMQYDQGLVIAVLIAAKVAMGGQQATPQQRAQGGMISGPGTGTSDSIHTQNAQTGQPVNVSTGEYIIPSHVVKAKGKEFFDNLLKKYHNPGAMQE